MTPPTDIVISVHDAGSDFVNLVNTLKAHTSNYRLILVDDVSSGDTSAIVRAVAAENPSSFYIRTNKQRWFTRAFNLGLRLVRTPRAIMLNSDCVVDKCWLDELYAVWDEVAATGARVGLVGSILSGDEPRRYTEYRRGKMDSTDYVSGHCWLVDMAAISDISCRRGTPGIYLDETKQDSIHINSDRYLCYDLQSAGYVTIASFKSAVGHLGGRSWGYNLGIVGCLKLDQVNDQYQ